MLNIVPSVSAPVPILKSIPVRYLRWSSLHPTQFLIFRCPYLRPGDLDFSANQYFLVLEFDFSLTPPTGP